MGILWHEPEKDQFVIVVSIRDVLEGSLQHLSTFIYEAVYGAD